MATFKKSVRAALHAASLLACLGWAPQAAAVEEPFLGQIAWVAFNFAPKNWALCNGQLLPIAQNQALFSLLGTTFGGNGTTTFALPDMRGRAPIHEGNGHLLGEQAGAQTHALTVSELPAHTHSVQVDAREASVATPTNTSYLAKTSGGTSAYGSTATVALASASVAAAGASQAHENMKPYIPMTCIIALQGVFPSPN